MSDLLPEKLARGKDTISVSQLLEGASDAAFAIDDHHHVIAWNQSAEKLLGYTPDEVIGRRCAEVLQSVLPGGEPLCMPDRKSVV